MPEQVSSTEKGFSREERERMRHDPRIHMMNKWKHPADPARNYDFYDGEGDNPLLYLTDDRGPLNPEMWGDVNVLLFARGCLKTTSCVGVLDWVLDEWPNTEAFNTAPTEDQYTEVVDRFKERAEDSGLKNRRTKNNISHQKFKTTVEMDGGRREQVYSHLKSRSGYGGGDKIRGIHANVGVIDEFQDAGRELFEVFLEAIDQSVPGVPYFPTSFVIGTPKMETSFFKELWEMSDQKTWKTDENGVSGEWVAQSDSDEYEAGDGDFTIKGWHISQPNSPLHDEKLAYKKENYAEKKYQNEVLANFYSPEDDLITDEEVLMNFRESNDFRSRRFYDDSRVVVGVDWGGGQRRKASKTVIATVEKIEDDTGTPFYYILDIEFVGQSVTPQGEIEMVENKIRRYDADAAICDYGHGNKNIKDLQDGNGTVSPDGYSDVVSGCQYGNIKNKYEVKWDKSGDRRFFTVDRSYMMEQFVDTFKNDEYIIPSGGKNWDANDSDSPAWMLRKHLTAPYKEAKETSSGRKKISIKSDDARNDDAFHALTYCYIGTDQTVSKRQVRRIAGGNVPGV